jgi:hypothetical protein
VKSSRRRRYCHDDLNDHDEFRHDPLMSLLAAKLEASRSDCATVAGKFTLNRLELSRDRPTKYAKIANAGWRPSL